MQEIWKKDIPVYENMKYRRKMLKGDFLYILFHDIDKKKSESYNYQILKLNLLEGRYEFLAVMYLIMPNLLILKFLKTWLLEPLIWMMISLQFTLWI